MKKLMLFLLLLAWWPGVAQITIRQMQVPSWFGPYATNPRNSFFEYCPTEFTLPKGHFIAFMGNLNKNQPEAYKKGVRFGHAGSMTPLPDSISTFLYNEYWLRGLGTENWRQWIDTHTASDVSAAYRNGINAPPGNVGITIDDWEGYGGPGFEGSISRLAKMRKAFQDWKKFNQNRYNLHGNWNTSFFKSGMKTKEQIARCYNSPVSTILANPLEYGFNEMALDVHADSAGHQAAMDFFDVVPNETYSQYPMGDLTHTLICNSEIIKRVFPKLIPFGFQAGWKQFSIFNQTTPTQVLDYFGNPALNGDGTLKKEPQPFVLRAHHLFKGRKFSYDGDQYPYGVWSASEISYCAPVEYWNYAIWSLLYGSFLHWDIGQARTDNGNDWLAYHMEELLQGLKWINLAGYYYGADPEVKAIMEASTPVIPLEFSMDGGTSWYTGDYTQPLYARDNGWPVARGKQSADGKKMLILVYDASQTDGNTRALKVRKSGTNIQWDVTGDRWTRMYVSTYTTSY